MDDTKILSNERELVISLKIISSAFDGKCSIKSKMKSFLMSKENDKGISKIPARAETAECSISTVVTAEYILLSCSLNSPTGKSSRALWVSTITDKT